VVAFVCTLYRGDSRVPKSSQVYDASWADKLYRGIKRNISQPFRFICLTDYLRGAFEEKAIEVVPFELWHHVGGCMTALECFRPDLEIKRGFYTGLDTVITGSLDEIISYSGEFAMCTQPCNAHHSWPAKKRTPKFCSGLVGFDRTAADELWREWSEKQDMTYGRIWSSSLRSFFDSDMFWMEHHREGRIEALDQLYPGQILPHTRYRQQKGTRLVYFFGPEKPHNTGNARLRKCWI
jgi:hypothetical protein